SPPPRTAGRAGPARDLSLGSPPAHRPGQWPAFLAVAGACLADPAPGLLASAALGGATRLRELRDEGVAGLLELLDPGHVGAGHARRGRHVERDVTDIAAELRLEHGDLTAQLAADADHFRLGRVDRRGGGGGSAGGGGGAWRAAGDLGADERDLGELAGAESGGMGFADRLGGDLL